MKLSLWLIPPGGKASDSTTNVNVGSSTANNSNNAYERTIRVIDELSATFGGPRFVPHITIMGGIHVDSEEEANALSKRLREGLEHFGKVRCNFGDVLREPLCWNQALIVEMIPSESFLKLCRLTRRILSNTEQEETGDPDLVAFPPPSEVPHMSLFYGDSPLSDPHDSATNHRDYLSQIFGTNDDGDGDGDGDDKKSFQSHRVMLWKTEPSSASGVAEWQPLADISLL